jgi:hypothetical protein
MPRGRNVERDSREHPARAVVSEMFEEVLSEVREASEGSGDEMRRLVRLELAAQLHRHYNQPSDTMVAQVGRAMEGLLITMGETPRTRPSPMSVRIREERDVRPLTWLRQAHAAAARGCHFGSSGARGVPEGHSEDGQSGGRGSGERQRASLEPCSPGASASGGVTQEGVEGSRDDQAREGPPDSGRGGGVKG